MIYNPHYDMRLPQLQRQAGTAFCSDPGFMRNYGLACINMRAKYRRLKGWQKVRKAKK